MTPTLRRIHGTFLLLAICSITFVFAPVLIEQPAHAQTDEVRVVTDLPSNRPLTVDKQDDGSFRITVEEPRSEWMYYWKWWMFRVDNAKGKTVTFELYNKENGHKWQTLHPVYMNGGNVRDPAAFQTESDGNTSIEDLGDEAPIPNTNNQKWNFIKNTSGTDNGLTFTHTFESNRVWVAMRYPFLMSMANRYYDGLKQRAQEKDLPLHVHEIGHTENGHRMRVFQVGSFPPDDNRPTAVLYAREHATDHDAAWTMVGALEYLLSEDKQAKKIRKTYNIFVVPTLDRQAAHQGIHHDICKTFRKEPRSRAARNYMNWFQTKWIDRGGRVDFVFDLHNYESNETDNHLKCWLLPGRGNGEKFHELATDEFTKLGYRVKSDPSNHGHTPNRFAGRLLSASGGGVPMYYMVNSQAPSRHLTLDELKFTGALLVRSTSRWFEWLKTSGGSGGLGSSIFGGGDGNFGKKNSETDDGSDKSNDADSDDDAVSEDNDTTSKQSSLVGQTAPDFSLNTLEGDTFKLSDQFGKHVVILDFWASWCGPCVKSMPILTEVADKYSDRGVRFVGVNQRESRSTIKSFMKKHDLEEKMVLDTNGSVAKKYRVRGIPHTVIIDPSGTVRFVHVGYQSGLKSIIERDIKRILNEEKSDK